LYLALGFRAATGERWAYLLSNFILGRLLACVAEAHHDEHGLIWPIAIAPFQVHLILLAGKSSDPALDRQGKAEQLYSDLRNTGIEVLFDDRNESPGVKFNDADLMGIPLRITVSERALSNGGIEFKQRDQSERVIIPHDQIVSFLENKIATLSRDIASTLTKEILEHH